MAPLSPAPAPLARAHSLKKDSLGSVERIACAHGEFVARRASGGAIPGSAWLARLLLRRERRALERLRGLPGVPELPPQAGGCACLAPWSRELERGRALVRRFVPGQPLSRAEALPADFFDELERLVRALHARGVCHNDLHKEQNILVGTDGWPHVIDFQLASVHARRGRLFASRVGDDLRHVSKHRRRYLLQDRPKSSLSEAERRLPRRSWLAALWRRSGKPLYQFTTRRVLRWRDGEERRPTAGPWPVWTAARGPREFSL